MQFISWNVNGLRACLGKNFMEFFSRADADFFCVQETKMQREQAELVLPGYTQFWNSAVKKGYSGTAVFSKHEPLSVEYNMGLEPHSFEGRCITLELEEFYLVNAYAPNLQRELTRLSYRMQWEDDFRAYLCGLDEKKPVIVCGDLNVAHREIDLKNPGPNRGNAGFTDEERAKMTQLLQAGFADTFRELYPEKQGAYTWWSYRFNARKSNAGWRIDYFLVSRRLCKSIEEAAIYSEVVGSDHCPVGLKLKNL